jgi:hypothetical protein
MRAFLFAKATVKIREYIDTQALARASDMDASPR